MISVQSTSFQSISSDISALRENLNAHAKDGNRCEEFFSLPSKPKWGQSNDFSGAHFQYQWCFSKMFSCISENHLEQWKEKYQKISQDVCLLSPIEEVETINIELEELNNKIELSEKTNKVFCEKFISLIQNNAEVILHTDNIFFLPPLHINNGGIGECHCCIEMGREYRQRFSRELTREIATCFPDKKSISIASIGAGTCFHELEIHTLALQKGYSISEWTLVDPMLFSKMAKNFTTIVKWATPNTTVIAVNQEDREYFNSLQNSATVPDVFLFIDVGRHIHKSQVEGYAQKINQLGLFAYFSEKQEWAEYYNSKVAQ